MLSFLWNSAAFLSAIHSSVTPPWCSSSPSACDFQFSLMCPFHRRPTGSVHALSLRRGRGRQDKHPGWVTKPCGHAELKRATGTPGLLPPHKRHRSTQRWPTWVPWEFPVRRAYVTWVQGLLSVFSFQTSLHIFWNRRWLGVRAPCTLLSSVSVF